MALFGKKKGPAAPAKAESAPVSREAGRKETTYLGPKLTVKGTVSGDGNVIIMGELEGRFDLKGELTIAEPATVKGEIAADMVAIKGRVEGTLRASKNLHLDPSARVAGKVIAKRMSMAEGARLDGELSMSATPAEPSTAAAGAAAND